MSGLIAGAYAGLAYEVVPTQQPDGLTSYEFKFQKGDTWTLPHAIDTRGELRRMQFRKMLTEAYENATGIRDFIPWHEHTEALHFNVWINGVATSALVSRECLEDHNLVSWQSDRDDFVSSETADRLRALALKKLADRKQPLIGTSDW